MPLDMTINLDRLRSVRLKLRRGLVKLTMCSAVGLDERLKKKKKKKLSTVALIRYAGSAESGAESASASWHSLQCRAPAPRRQRPVPSSTDSLRGRHCRVNIRASHGYTGLTAAPARALSTSRARTHPPASASGMGRVTMGRDGLHNHGAESVSPEIVA